MLSWALLLGFADSVMVHLLSAQYNDMSASMAFLRAALAAHEVSEGLKNNHGVVRDFMRELLCGVSPHPCT